MGQEYIDLLKEKDVAAAYIKDDNIHFCYGKMIKPLVDLYLSKEDLKGAIIVDKIVGRAAASFFIELGIKECYGEVMSKPGLLLLKKYGIEASYGILTENIMRHDGLDLCPMEKICIAQKEDPKACVQAIIEKVITH